MSLDHLYASPADLRSGPTKGRFHCRTTLEPEGPGSAVRSAVARAKDGDPEAIRFLYMRYADSVHGYVRSIVRDEHEAEDVTQYVFTKVITQIGKYEERAVPFSAWILRVARNVAVDHLRRARAIPCEEIRGSAQDSEESADELGWERAHCLSDALDGLMEDQRNVLVMRHVLGLSPAEIAKQLGRSESSVHGLHHRGRRALQRELASMEMLPATAKAA